MDVARLNFSHGDHASHEETAQLVRDAASRVGRPVALLQDLPGPKIRIGPLEGDKAILRGGDSVTFRCGGEETTGTAQTMTVAWPGLASAVEIGEAVYLADGSVRLRVKHVREAEGEFDTEVELGGMVASRQGLNIPGPADQLPSVPEEDLEHLRAGLKIGVDMVALSFVRTPEDVLQVREHTRVPLIAKIEKPQAVARAEDIVRAATASWSRAATSASNCRSRRCRWCRSDSCASPASARGPRSPPRRCSTRWCAPHAPPGPR